MCVCCSVETKEGKEVCIYLQCRYLVHLNVIVIRPVCVCVCVILILLVKKGHFFWLWSTVELLKPSSSLFVSLSVCVYPLSSSVTDWQPFRQESVVLLANTCGCSIVARLMPQLHIRTDQTPMCVMYTLRWPNGATESPGVPVACLKMCQITKYRYSILFIQVVVIYQSRVARNWAVQPVIKPPPISRVSGNLQCLSGNQMEFSHNCVLEYFQPQCLLL